MFGTIYFIDFITVKTQQSLAIPGCKTLLCFDGNKINKVNIIQVIKSRIMRWAEYAARMRGRRGLYRGLEGRPDGKIPLERHRYSGRIIKCIFKKWGVEAWSGLLWLRIGSGGGRL